MPNRTVALEIPNLPWPDENTKIFLAGEIRPGLAWLPQSPGQWHAYAEGYREAAEWLYAKWREDQIKPDYLAYPMVYLYRHFVELMLKEILQSGSQAGVVELGKNWKCDHNLKRLWDKVRSVLSPLFPGEPRRDLANAQRLIYELHERDESAQEFRYPISQEGKKHLANMERLDIDNFFDAMRRLASFLDGMSGQFADYLDHLRSAY
jgi:hypothetical protein